MKAITTQAGGEKMHTPGPWKQHETEGKVYASVRGANNEIVADCGSRSDKQAQANAALIAAAPELLDMLTKLHNEYAHYGKGYWVGTGQAVERLIAKAGGRV